MRRWLAGMALVALCVAGAAALGLGLDDRAARPLPEGERTRLEKQLSELQAQREKVDSQIADVRRRLGREDVRAEVRRADGMTPAQRAELDRALAEARRAIDEARRSIPDAQALMPEVEKSLRLYMGPGALTLKPLTPEQREEMRRDVERLRSDMKARTEDLRKLVVPRVFSFDGGWPGAGDPEMRAELRRLRKELEDLRAQVEKERAPGQRAPKDAPSEGVPGGPI